MVCVSCISESTAETLLLLLVHMEVDDEVEGDVGDNEDEVWRELAEVKLFEAEGDSVDSVVALVSRILPSLETSNSLCWVFASPASSFWRSLCLLRTRLKEDGSVVDDVGISWSNAGRTSLPSVATG